MKKILLTMGLFSLVVAGRSQTILNELYVQPGTATSEFFELYYAGTLPIGDNVDCWTLVSYFDLGTEQGVYVMDLPNVTTGFSNRYMVGSSTTPFTAQGSTSQVPNFNWNAMPASGRLTKWTVSGGVWTQQADPVNLLDFFNNKGGGGFNYSAMIFVNGTFNNGFLGGSTSGTSSIITSLPALLLTTANSNVCAPFTINWSTLGAMEFVISAAGKDNGYNRTSDGKCGAWEKSSSSSEHTPGSTNGSASGISGALTTSQGTSCGTVPRVGTYTITGISGSVTLADDFPVTVQVYNDINNNGFDGADTIIKISSLTAFSTATPPAAGSSDTVQLKGALKNASLIFVYKTDRGCFDKVVVSNICSPLPVIFKSFTAARNHATVGIKWTTASEQNNTGFAIERLVGAGGWQEIGFVPSQALHGSSEADLNYEYSDLNNTSAMSQYRLKQIDFDNKSSRSDIRAVRGEGQVGKIITYPNPSNNGRVTVVFEDVTATRDATLIDMSGRMIKQMKGVTNNNIQFENLTPGVYSLRVVNRETGDQVVQKIVVNNR